MPLLFTFSILTRVTFYFFYRFFSSDKEKEFSSPSLNIWTNNWKSATLKSHWQNSQTTTTTEKTNKCTYLLIQKMHPCPRTWSDCLPIQESSIESSGWIHWPEPWTTDCVPKSTNPNFSILFFICHSESNGQRSEIRQIFNIGKEIFYFSSNQICVFVED